MGRTLTHATIETFGCLTGDYNAMHLDHTAMAQGPIAHGLLTASLALGAEAWNRSGDGGVDAALRFQQATTFRLRESVRPGDTLELTASDNGHFTLANQAAQVVCDGEVETVAFGPEVLAECSVQAPEPLQVSAFPLEMERTCFADDLLQQRFGGAFPSRTIAESQALQFAALIGDENPLYVNEVRARAAGLAGRMAHPMFCFALGFAGWLQELLRLPLPATGFAGHVGDSWRWYRPVYFGDTLQVRHCVTGTRASRSRPGLALTTFALQLLNQRDEVVLAGEVVLLVPSQAA